MGVNLARTKMSRLGGLVIPDGVSGSCRVVPVVRHPGQWRPAALGPVRRSDHRGGIGTVWGRCVGSSVISRWP